ncbi:MAG: hypothetical protein HYV09_08125 [Deltaproteobacteria bacterium]|nr:hypothetical protein [Deltaproteobacteria bacterium]
MRSIVMLVAACALTLGCEAADPEPRPLLPATDADAPIDAPLDADPSCSKVEELAPLADDPACQPNPGDYVPAADDGWPVCISDDGAYHRFNASISSVTRIDAFERIAGALGFGTDVAPTPADFVDAKAIFAEDQGLGSRVERREDEHYPAPPAACNTLPAEQLALYADRCVGPAKLVPVLNAAFADGVAGRSPRAAADRIEAALLWFLYLSPFKEARTCATKVDDCDSSYAYYTGGDPKEQGKGFARYVRARSPQTHAAIWNGILAVRCWRDLDNPTGAAADLATRDKAVAQLDRALTRGLAVIVRQRVARRLCGASWSGTRMLGAVLDREATARDAGRAAILRAELAKSDPSTVDEKALVAALDGLFPCAYR